MKRNKFSLSRYKLLSCDMGNLVPIGLTEVLPGDSFQMSSSVLLRASPLLAPVMHPVDVRIHHWFVPNRLVWTNWENFITGGPDGMDASVPPFQQGSSFGNVPVGSLHDYLGVPTGYTGNFSALPNRGYQMIWNEFYRDQDLETPIAIAMSDGVDLTASPLQRCAWEKDYFTTARPWQQKGPEVTLPLGTTAPVKGIGFSGTMGTDTTNAAVRETTPLPNRNYAHSYAPATSGTQLVFEGDSAASGTTKPLIFADLAQASAVTVTRLREALAIQRFEEHRARFGSRYTEVLRSWGVRSSDARLQRPEYLGGGRETIQFSEVLAHASTAATNTNVGDLKGHGIASARSNRFRRFFEEHGYIHTLLSVRPKTIYMNGLPKHWSRTVKNDYWQPEFQFVGQEQVINKEIMATGVNPENRFGWQDRYDSYRRYESGVSGEFRTLLNHWHFARDFAATPALNASFVSCVPTERPFAVNTTNVLWIMAKHSVQARRLVAKTGVSFIQ